MTTCTFASGERVQVASGSVATRVLPFTGAHLGDLPWCSDGPADQLDVEVPLADRPLRGFADGGERFGQEVVERVASACLRLVALDASALRRRAS